MGSICRFSVRYLLSAALLAGLVIGIEQAAAKKPGVKHCYGGVCHHVLTVAATARLIGTRRTVHASFYDHPSIDRFNTGKFTSDGEMFDASSPARVASSDLPDGTELLLRNPQTGHASHVRVNDFGPFKATRKLDVTRRVAENLHFKGQGLAELEIYVITAPLPEDTIYRRNRSAHEPLGDLGVVEPLDVPALVQRLIRERTRISIAAVPATVLGPVVSEVAVANALPFLAETTGGPAEIAAITVGPSAAPLNAAETTLVAVNSALSAQNEARTSVAFVESRNPKLVQLADAQPDGGMLERLIIELKTWSASHGDLPAVAAIASSTSLLLLWAMFAAAAPRRSAVLQPQASPAAEASDASPLPPPAFAGSIISADVEVVGRIETQGALALNGSLRGTVVAGLIEVREHGVVDGQINAGKAIVAGVVLGRLQADHVLVTATGRVIGEIIAATIAVEAGADIDGTISRPRARPRKMLRPDIRLVFTGMSEPPERTIPASGKQLARQARASA